jgi:hypothetical protein
MVAATIETCQNMNWLCENFETLKSVQIEQLTDKHS